MRVTRKTILEPLARYGVQDWLWFILPVAIALALLLGSGSTLQDFANRAIVSQQSSYQQAIPRLPDLTIWLVGALLHPYALISLISILLALRRENVGAQAAALAFWVGTLLTASDIFVKITGASPDVEFPQTILFNYIGGALLSVIYIGLVTIYFYIYDINETNRHSRRIIPAAAIISSGIILSCFAYVALSFSYQPVSGLFYAEFENDAAGIAISDPPRSLPASNPSQRLSTDDEGFSQFPKSSISGRLRVTNAGDRQFSAMWKSLDQKSSHELSISAFIDCPFVKIEDLPQATPMIADEPSDFVLINADGGNTDIFSMISGQILMYGDQIFSLGTKNSDKAQHRNLSGYIGSGTGIRYRTHEDITFLIGTSLLESNGTSSTPTRAIFDINTGHRDHHFTFTPKERLISGDKLDCRSVNLRPQAKSDQAEAGIYASILVTIKTVSPSPVFRIEAQELDLRSLNGWVEVDDVPLDDIKNESLGKLQGIFAQSGLIHLEVGGKKIEVRPSDNLQALGTFRGYYGDEGNLTISVT